MSNTKKQFVLIPMTQLPRVTVRRPVNPKPVMYTGKAKNGVITPRKKNAQ